MAENKPNPILIAAQEERNHARQQRAFALQIAARNNELPADLLCRDAYLILAWLKDGDK